MQSVATKLIAVGAAPMQTQDSLQTVQSRLVGLSERYKSDR